MEGGSFVLIVNVYCNNVIHCVTLLFLVCFYFNRLHLIEQVLNEIFVRKISTFPEATKLL